MDLTQFGFRKDYDPKNRIVKQENFTYQGDVFRISTIDLGIDHAFGDSVPLYYETMIFPEGSSGDLYCERYTTRREAENGHRRVLEDIKSRRMILKNGYFQESEGGLSNG